MASGALFLYHFALLAIPLAALALMRFRLTPALLLMAVLHHHPMEPMPGDQDPPPICCALAQSTEAEPEPVVRTAVRVFWLPLSPSPLIASRIRTPKPAIRAPPYSTALPPPATYAPAFWAA
jgi:hypothetical protein